jgi:hypothetical protein
MSPSDSGTDYDSNLGIPGSLTDTTDSPRSSEPPYERRRMMDAVNRLRATRRVLSILITALVLTLFVFQHPWHRGSSEPGKTTTH